jgi:branched-chain amino acid transport system permease protein
MEPICGYLLYINKTKSIVYRHLPTHLITGVSSMVSDIVSILILGVIVTSMYMLISTGFTIIYSVGNILDLSYFAFLMIGAYLYLFLYNLVPSFTALVVSIIVISLLYVLMYRVIIKRIVHNPVMVAVITVLFNLVLEYLFTIIFSRAEKNLFPIIPGVTEVMGTKFHTNMFFVVGLSLVAMSGFWLFVKRTFLGKAILALSMDKKGSQLSGIDPDKTMTVVYAISGIMAGLSGISYGAYTAVYPEMFMFPMIIALAIALIGGLGSIKGTVIASIIIGFMEIMTAYLWDPKARGLSALFCIILILYIRPRGLFGREATL